MWNYYCTTSILISRFMTLLISTYYHKYYTIKSYEVVPVPVPQVSSLKYTTVQMGGWMTLMDG
jgi:hypothetical protein